MADDHWKSEANPWAYWHDRPLNTTDWPRVEVVGEYGAAPWGKLKFANLLLPPPSHLRTAFQATKPVQRATVYAPALGIHDLHLNGQCVSDDFFNPGWTDYTRRVYYRAYDVTAGVHPRANALGAILADGWFSSCLGFGKMRHHYGQATRLKAQLHLVYTDGSTKIVATGPDWKAAVGPMLEADFLMGETYDARLAMPGWATAGFNDSHWAPAVVGADLKPVIQADPGPPVRAIAELERREITEPKPGVFVLDMGQNFAGVPRLEVHGEPGQKITLRFAERLNPDGTIYTTNLRCARCMDTYTCMEGDRNLVAPVHVPRLPIRRGHRPQAPPGPRHADGHGALQRHPRRRDVRVLRPDAQPAPQNIYWTQRANFIDIPTDCPQRDERMGWTGDAQVYIRTATLNTDVQAFFTKWLVDLDDGQRADGQFPMVAPVRSPVRRRPRLGRRRRDLSLDHLPGLWRSASAGAAIPIDASSSSSAVNEARPSCCPRPVSCFGDWLSIGATRRRT